MADDYDHGNSPHNKTKFSQQSPKTTRQKIKRHKRESSNTPQPATRPLCEMCIERNFEGSLYHKKEPGRLDAGCEICRGLMGELDSLAAKIVRASTRFQFQTFLIGAILPTQIYDREDAIRARLKIRGRESVKGQFTRELGLKFTALTGKKVDYLRPDLTASLTVDKDNIAVVSIRTKPLLLLGSYVKKKRGIDQKAQRCTKCDGKGCESCSNSGLASFDGSVEGIVAHGLISKTRGLTPRFSWVGSEDRESLVLGKGRPFYVRVYNPMKRKLPGRIHISEKGVFARLCPITNDFDSPDTQPRFIVKTKITVTTEDSVAENDLKKLEKLAGQEVILESKGNKTATKKIYSISVSKNKLDKEKDSRFSLTVVADGGLAIKQFVGGEQYSSASVSQMVGTKCHCSSFDILAVTFLSDTGKQTLA